MIRLINLSFFPEEEFGLNRINLTLEDYGRYLIHLDHQDQTKGLLGILEGRYHPHGGIVDFGDKRPFVQSDRQLLGEKVYSQEAGSYWLLKDPVFYLGGKRSNKFFYLDELRAKSLRHFPIYKLRGEERLKFCLLSLLFQEKGLILLSEIFLKELTEPMRRILDKIIQESRVILVMATHSVEGLETATSCFGEKNFQLLEPTKSL